MPKAESRSHAIDLKVVGKRILSIACTKKDGKISAMIQRIRTDGPA